MKYSDNINQSKLRHSDNNMKVSESDTLVSNVIFLRQIQMLEWRIASGDFNSYKSIIVSKTQRCIIVDEQNNCKHTNLNVDLLDCVELKIQQIYIAYY